MPRKTVNIPPIADTEAPHRDEAIIPLRHATADDVGKTARTLLTDGTQHTTGTITGYYDGPTVMVRRADGTELAWLAALTQVVEDKPVPVPRQLLDQLRNATTPSKRYDAVVDILNATKDA